MINLTSFIRFHASRTPAREALIYGDLRLNFADLHANMTSIAGYLAEAGVCRGDVIAVCMRNSPAFYDLAFAASHIGAVFLPLNYRLAGEEMAWILDHAGAVRLFHDTEFSETVQGINIPSTGIDPDTARNSRRLSRNAPAPEAAEVSPEDVFRLMYTSGTTDRPKGVPHSYANFYWKCIDQTAVLNTSAADRLLVVGPLYHVGGFDLPGINVWHQGGTIVLHREVDAKAVAATIAAERITGAWLAPTMTNGLLALPDLAGFDFSSLQWVIGGGERTPETRILEFGRAFPNARYIDAYGLTETVGGDTMMEAGRELEKIGSVGRPTLHVRISIRDDEGKNLEAGREGEICLRGPKITRGYWRDPERTRESFFGEWFRSGDVGYLDADGFLYLTDRRKDMILSGGENIASSEIERVLYEHGAVHEAAAIGIPDSRWGERPVAVVVTKPGASIDYAELEHHCRARLAGFKTPKELHLRKELPRNPSGKVLKRVLREEILAAAGRGAQLSNRPA